MNKKTFLVVSFLITVLTSVATVQAVGVDAGPDQAVYVGQTVSFTGSAPLDIHTIEWDFGDGSPVVSGLDTSILNTTTHVYMTAGIYVVTLRVETDGVFYAWESDTCIITVLQPGIESAVFTSPSSWEATDTFDLGDDICIVGWGFLPYTNYEVQIVNDVDWTDGMTIPAYVAKTTVTTDDLGEIGDAVPVWNDATAGKYDIIVDVNNNTIYDEGVDALDDSDIEVTAGFFVVPEVAIGSIMAAASMFTALGLYTYKKKHTPKQ